MIVFLNFAPIEYLGGAERKIYELFKYVSKREKAYIITIHESISSIYGKVVLKQEFENRSNDNLNLNQDNYFKLAFFDFIPFTNSWFKIRNIINKARIIYVKADMNEILILLYYGGPAVFSKIIAAIRSPLFYPSPKGLLNRLHNTVYSSVLMKWFLSKTKIVHVLNTRDKFFLEDNFQLKNVILIPPDVSIPNVQFPQKVVKKNLNIIFIGELLIRKGIDYLIDVIKNSPKDYHFNIVGKGPYRKKIESITRMYSNVTYHGYLEKEKLFKILNANDVLFFPSRAEGYGVVILEAMSFGLKVVNSPEIKLDLPKYIEYTVQNSNYSEYIKVFKKLYELKKKNMLERSAIRKYCRQNFSSDNIKALEMKHLFQL